MQTIIVTGSAGLIGSEACKFFHQQGFQIVGIDNDMRAYFFGEDDSTRWNQQKLEKEFPNYIHHSIDIRDYVAIEKVFAAYNISIAGVIHTAAQPSHDWAAKEPFTDFGINAAGTLNLLEATRKYCPNEVFIFTSTNKVYGDTPNYLPLVERSTRCEISEEHRFYEFGI